MPDMQLDELVSTRSLSYTFLSRVYREEPTREFLDALIANAVSSQADEAGEGNKIFNAFLIKFKGADMEQTRVDLAAEYAALFLNASRHPVFPFESVYTSPDGLIMQRARDEVLQEYRRAGLARVDGFNEPEDHIAIEYEFMASLCRKTIEALQAKNLTAALDSLRWQQEFCEKHLSVWVPKFCQDLAKGARSDFYKGAALLTAEFLETEQETIPAMIAELETGQA
jgi:putative dimethyl sulfoxide reductase chaperone